MNNVSVWLFAAHIVEISLIIMFGVYVFLTVFQSKKKSISQNPEKPISTITALIVSQWNDKEFIQSLIKKLQEHERNLSNSNDHRNSSSSIIEEKMK